MKRNIFLIISLVLLIAASKTNGQALITKNDSIPLGQDTLINIVLPEARGNIQWQKSLDSKSWINLAIETNDTLLVKSDVEALYRAIVTDGTCLPVISDSIGVVTKDSITKNYVNPITLGLELVSDSIDISNGNYIYTGTDNTNGLEIGKVIIDEPSGGTIRRITDIIQTGDMTSVKTEQATLEDLFINTSFKLSTELIYPSQNLKSASVVEIEHALTDKDGFIHPLRVISKSPEGKVLKSASALSKNNNSEGGSLYLHLGLSDFSLWNYSGSFTVPDPNGLSFTYSGNTKTYIKELSLTFDPIFKFEADFDLPGINWKNFKINKGELRMFKFYSDRSLLDIKKIIYTESNVAYKIGKVFTFNPNYIHTFEFIVGGVPVFVDFVIELKSSISASFGEGAYAITKGFNNKYFITAGASYENKSWSLIKNIEKEQEVYSFSTHTQNNEFRISIYPEVTMQLYSIVGPKLKVGPYLQNKTNSSNNGNWDESITLGADASVGVTADILGKEIFSLSTTPWNFYSNVLFESPNKLILVAGDNQSGKTGEQLPSKIYIRVENSKGENVEGVQVHFAPAKGSVSQSVVKTDIDGRAQTNWTLSENSGEHTMRVYLLDGKDQEIDGCSLTVKATATSLSLPTVTTTAITAITQTIATSGGNVTTDGGAAVTARGVCWSTSQNPTTDNSKTTDGTGTGSFTSSLTGLIANTPYYVRAYATNSQGTTYGNEVTFTTSNNSNNIIFNPNLTYGSITDIDGNVYKTIQIGSQTWMAENLRTTKYNDGTAIQNVFSQSEWAALNTGAYVWYNHDQLTYSKTYGALYNWYAVNSEKLAPEGWHVPTEEEWNTLIDYLGNNLVAGGQMKEEGSIHWNSPNIDASNMSGFSALPGGLRFDESSDDFYYMGEYGYWWSSTESSSSTAWIHTIGNGSGSIPYSSFPKTFGLSVRCVLDNDDNQDIILPEIVSENISNITQSSATGGGIVISDGGATVTARGVCWSTSSNPTTANSKTTNGTGTGSFTSSLTGLTSNTPYYVRAYATNSQGISYGNQVSFTTSSDDEKVSITPSNNCATAPVMDVNTTYSVSIEIGDYTTAAPIDGESYSGADIRGFWLAFKVPSNWGPDHDVRIFNVSNNFNPVFGIKSICTGNYVGNRPDMAVFVNKNGYGGDETSDTNLPGSENYGEADNTYYIRIYHYKGSETPSITFDIAIE